MKFRITMDYYISSRLRLGILVSTKHGYQKWASSENPDRPDSCLSCLSRIARLKFGFNSSLIMELDGPSKHIY